MQTHEEEAEEFLEMHGLTQIPDCQSWAISRAAAHRVTRGLSATASLEQLHSVLGSRARHPDYVYFEALDRRAGQIDRLRFERAAAKPSATCERAVDRLAGMRLARIRDLIATTVRSSKAYRPSPSRAVRVVVGDSASVSFAGPIWTLCVKANWLDTVHQRIGDATIGGYLVLDVIREVTAREPSEMSLQVVVLRQGRGHSVRVEQCIAHKLPSGWVRGPKLH